MGTFYIPNEKGDARVTWDKAKTEEVAVAKTAFKTYKDKGYRAYRINKRNEPGDPITEFDKDAEEILFLAPIAGG